MNFIATGMYLPAYQQTTDSDEEEANVNWQQMHQRRLVEEFCDVTYEEKLLMNMWNEHRMKYSHVSGNNQVSMSDIQIE